MKTNDSKVLKPTNLNKNGRSDSNDEILNEINKLNKQCFDYDELCPYVIKFDTIDCLNLINNKIDQARKEEKERILCLIDLIFDKDRKSTYEDKTKYLSNDLRLLKKKLFEKTNFDIKLKELENKQ